MSKPQVVNVRMSRDEHFYTSSPAIKLDILYRMLKSIERKLRKKKR